MFGYHGGNKIFSLKSNPGYIRPKILFLSQLCRLFRFEIPFNIRDRPNVAVSIRVRIGIEIPVPAQKSVFIECVVRQVMNLHLQFKGIFVGVEGEDLVYPDLVFIGPGKCKPFCIDAPGKIDGICVRFVYHICGKIDA